MKYLILLLTLVLFVPMIEAATVEKPLVNISNCYNLTISVNLIEGKEVPISFSGCSQTGATTYFCNCYSASGELFRLKMWTDDTILRDRRTYDFRIKANLFTFKKETFDVSVDDWGDYVDMLDADYSDLGDDVRRVDVVYVNNTVYVNRTETVFVPKRVDVVEYKTVLVNVSVENTTRLDSCKLAAVKNATFYEVQLKNKEEVMRKDRIFGITIGVIVLILCALLLYLMNKDRKKAI